MQTPWKWVPGTRFSGLRRPYSKKPTSLEDKYENGEELDEPSLLIAPHPYYIQGDGPNDKIRELDVRCDH